MDKLKLKKDIVERAHNLPDISHSMLGEYDCYRSVDWYKYYNNQPLIIIKYFNFKLV